MPVRDEEWTDLVARFLTRARQLSELRFKLSTGQPDEDDLRSFLLTLRQFLMPSEPVFLFRMFNLAHKHLTSEELRTDLAASRKEWASFQRQRPA